MTQFFLAFHNHNTGENIPVISYTGASIIGAEKFVDHMNNINARVEGVYILTDSNGTVL